MSITKLIEDCRYCHSNHNINNCFKLKRKNEKKSETPFEKNDQNFPALTKVTSKKPPPQRPLAQKLPPPRVEQSYVDFEEAFLLHMEDDIRLDQMFIQY